MIQKKPVPTTMTTEQIREKFMPSNFAMPKNKFYSEKADREFRMPSRPSPLPVAVHIETENGPYLITSFDFGSYAIKFSGHDYISKNKIEFDTLSKQVGIVCMGPVAANPAPEKKQEKPTMKFGSALDELRAKASRTFA